MPYYSVNFSLAYCTFGFGSEDLASQGIVWSWGAALLGSWADLKSLRVALQQSVNTEIFGAYLHAYPHQYIGYMIVASYIIWELESEWVTFQRCSWHNNLLIDQMSILALSLEEEFVESFIMWEL